MNSVVRESALNLVSWRRRDSKSKEGSSIVDLLERGDRSGMTKGRPSNKSRGGR